jgi:hypothetical protein
MDRFIFGRKDLLPRKSSILLLLFASIILLGSTSSVFLYEFKIPEAPTANIPWLGHEIFITMQDSGQGPAVAYNWKRAEYLVVWWTFEGIFGQRINSSGELVGPTNFAISTGPKIRRDPAVAYDPFNERFFVVWSHDVSGNRTNHDISGRLIPWEGPSLNFKEFKVNSSGADLYSPKVAYNTADREFLVVWWGSPNGQIFGARVNAFAGSLLGGEQAISPLLDNAGSADVAFNSTNGQYLVTWGMWRQHPTNYDIRGIRLKGDDISALGGGEFGIAIWPSSEVDPAVAVCKDANQYLVVWQSSAKTDIFGRIVLGNGNLTEIVYRLRETTRNESLPDAACSSAGNLFLAVWRQQYTDTSGPFGIWGSLVTPEGGGSICPGCRSNTETANAADPAFEVIAPTTDDYSRNEPAVAGGNDQYLVAWTNSCSGTGCYSIHARIIYLLKKPPENKFLPLIFRKTK